MSRIVKENLGAIIKNAIKEKGLNQSAIATKMNLKRQTINQLDRRKTFDLEFLQLLKEATGLDFTRYNFKSEPPESEEGSPSVPSFNSNETQQVELSLTIKIKAEPNQISKIGDLIKLIRDESKKMGFEVN